MRRFVRATGKVNYVFKLLSIILEIGHIICVFAPLSMIGLSPILSAVIAIAIFFLDKPAPVIAWIIHLVIWIISIDFATRCLIPNFIIIYIVCAAMYVLIEIIGTGAILYLASKDRN